MGSAHSGHVALGVHRSGLFRKELAIADGAAAKFISVAIFVFILVGAAAPLHAQLTQKWVKTVDGPGHCADRASAIVADANDNSYVTGSICLSTGSALLVVKYDKAGNIVWQDQVTSPGGASGSTIALDAAGNVYATGGSLPSSPNASQLIIIKYSPSGQKIWTATRVNSQGLIYIASPIQVDSAGNSYVAVKFATASGSFIGQPTMGVIKYDADGHQLWENDVTYPGGGPNIFPRDIAVDAQGNLYLVGVSNSNGLFPVDYRGFTEKFDTNGNLLWSENNASFTNSAIAVDSAGNAYVTGIQNNGQPAPQDSAFVQEFVLKYGPTGNHIWLAQYQTPGAINNLPSAIALDANGNVYTTGRAVIGPVPAQGPCGLETCGAAPNDYSTVKFDPTGKFLWEALYSGSGSSNDGAASLALDSSANVYVTGKSTGSGTGLDYATIEYDTNGKQLAVARYNGPQNVDDIPVGAEFAPAGGLNPGAVALGSTQLFVTGTSPSDFNSGNRDDWATVAYALGPVPAPSASVSPTTLTFSGTVGQVSAAQRVTVSNKGTAALNISAAPAISGTNAGDFAVEGSTTCTNGATVAAGSTCTIDVTFKPTATGSRSATLTIRDSDSSSPQTVALSGTGQVPPPTITVLPATLTFTSTVRNVSAAQTITVTNKAASPLTITAAPAISGANAADFAVASSTTCTNGATVAANNTCTIDVTFTPSATGSRSATLTIRDSDSSSPQTVTLSGTGQVPASPTVTVTPTSLTFSGSVGTVSSSQNVTIENKATSPLTITAAPAFTGANASDFAIASTSTCSNGAVLAFGGTCGIDVTFKPGAAGNRVATLVIRDNDSSSPQSVSLAGTGVNPTGPVLTFSPGSLAFPAEPIGTTTPPQSVTLSNTGETVLNISLITFGGTNPGDFKGEMTCGKTLAPGENCVATITFTPMAAGNRTAVLSVSDDEAGSPQTVSVTGKGSGIALTSAQPSITVNAGQTATYNVNLLPAAFNGTVTFACSGTPAGAACAITPASVAVNGDTPLAVTVTVTTTARSHVLPWVHFRFDRMLWLFLLASVLSMWLVLVNNPAWRLKPSFALLALLLIASVGCAGTTASGTNTGGGTPTPPATKGTPAGTSKLTLTATSGSATATLPLTLTVN